MRATPLALLAVATLVLPAAYAGHCEEPNLGRSADLTVKDPQTNKVRWYVVLEDCDATGCRDVRLYEETNGYGNLQILDLAAGVDDTCHGMIGADARLF